MLELVNKNIEYALCALIELALDTGSGALRAREIARRQGIPAAALEQVMVRLSRRGLVHSTRGPSGGYTLARPAADISVFDVVSVFAADRCPGSGGLPEAGPRAAVLRWAVGFEQAVSDILGRTTLKELAEHSKATDMAQAIMPGL